MTLGRREAGGVPFVRVVGVVRGWGGDIRPCGMVERGR